MSKSKAVVQVSEIVDQVSLIELCRICGSPEGWIVDLVDEGILEPVGGTQTAWRFESHSITIVQKVQRFQKDLRLNLPGVALVLSLVDENARLKRLLQLLENDPGYAIRMPGPD